MLGKLLKYEIKHSLRYIMSIYAAAAAAVLVVGISMLSDAVWLGMIACFALYVIGIAVIIVTLVSVIKNFNDTLYGRQGYLTFTLPVKCSTLLFSKVLVSAMWTIASFVISGFMYFMIFLYGKSKSSDAATTILDMLKMSGLMEYIPSTGALIGLLVAVVILAIVTIITYVGYVYFTVTIANTRLFASHPKFFGGLTFFAIMITVNTISNKLTEVLPLTLNLTKDKLFFSLSNMSADLEGVYFSYGIGGTIFAGLVALGLLFATGYIMENKVNLK